MTFKVLLTHENVPVGPLIVALFACFETDPKAQNSHYLMKALMRCFNIIDVRNAYFFISFMLFLFAG